MIRNLNDYLVGIAIGVRFRSNFSIEDQLGQIVDKILYSKNSYFNTTVFSSVLSNKEINEKVLINNESQDYLKINNSNFILEINFGKTFQPNDLNTILENFSKDIILGIMKDFNVRDINRIGMINRYLYKIEDLAKTFINKTIGSTLEGINDINLRFSKKIPEQESIIKKDLNDYYNVIFNIIKKSNRDELFISTDYQKYFNPFLPASKDIDYRAFYEKALGFNSSYYLNWLNENYGALNG